MEWFHLKNLYRNCEFSKEKLKNLSTTKKSLKIYLQGKQKT